MSTIKFVLDDDFNQRTVEFKTTLGGDSIDHYYEAFEAFLLAVGFVKDTIDRRYEGPTKNGPRPLGAA